MKPRINGIKFTVDTIQHPTFITDFQKFITNDLNLIENKRKWNNPTLNKKNYKLEYDFVDLVSIKITSNRYLTISFNMIYNVKSFYEINKNALKDTYKLKIEKWKDKYSLNKNEVLNRFRIIFCIYDFIKAKDIEMFNNAKIKSISLFYQIDGKENFINNHYKLLEIFSTSKDGSIYKTHTMNKDVTYTTDFKYYKCFIKYSENRKKHLNLPFTKFYVDLKKEIKYLNAICKVYFYQNKINIKDIYFKEDSSGRIFIYISKKEFEEYGTNCLNNNFISFLDKNSKSLNFKPHFDKNVNTCKLIFQDSQEKDLGYDYRNGFTSIYTKEKYIFELILNNFESKSKDICAKYEDINKHYFRLGDDLEDILNHINNLSKKYLLIQDPKNQLISDFNPIKTITRLHKYIKENDIQTFTYKMEELNSAISYLLGRNYKKD